MTDFYLGVDGGGTKTLAILVDDAGNLINYIKTGPTNIMECGERIFFESLDHISHILKGIEKTSVKSCFGMSAIGEYKGLEDKLKKLIYKKLEIIPNIIVNDVVIAWAGGFCGKDSVHVVSGTGSIVYGKYYGKEVRVGGWGPLIGDEGSGYYIGVEALREITKQIDGRGKKTILSDEFFKEKKISCRYDIFDWIKNLDKNFRSEIASLSHLISKTALEGDSVSQYILKKAAQELSLAVLSAINLLEISEKPIITYSGGVIENIPIYQNYFIKEIYKKFPFASINKSEYCPALGAIILLKNKIEFKFLQRLREIERIIKKE